MSQKFDIVFNFCCVNLKNHVIFFYKFKSNMYILPTQISMILSVLGIPPNFGQFRTISVFSPSSEISELGKHLTFDFQKSKQISNKILATSYHYARKSTVILAAANR